jgi:hypothetical protein
MTLVSAARLDNRAELLREFDIPSEDHATTDGPVLTAIKWERLCRPPQRRRRFAVWTTAAELFIARDHHGVTGLYYQTPFLAFASVSRGCWPGGCAASPRPPAYGAAADSGRPAVSDRL